MNYSTYSKISWAFILILLICVIACSIVGIHKNSITGWLFYISGLASFFLSITFERIAHLQWLRDRVPRAFSETDINKIMFTPYDGSLRALVRYKNGYGAELEMKKTCLLNKDFYFLNVTYNGDASHHKALKYNMYRLVMTIQPEKISSILKEISELED